jgi:nucleoid-associated protein YgaU
MALAACLAMAAVGVGCAGGPGPSRGKAAAGLPAVTVPERRPAVVRPAPPAPTVGREQPAPPVKPETPPVPAVAAPKPAVSLEATPFREKSPVLPASYTWKAGDKLFLLARRFYGDGRLWPKIVEANPDVQDLLEIPVGTVLVIPPK